MWSTKCSILLHFEQIWNEFRHLFWGATALSSLSNPRTINKQQRIYNHRFPILVFSSTYNYFPFEVRCWYPTAISGLQRISWWWLFKQEPGHDADLRPSAVYINCPRAYRICVLIYLENQARLKLKHSSSFDNTWKRFKS